MNIDGVSILARGITALGRSGPVFENVDLSIASGSLAVVAGEARSGKTAMLLALSGRFRLAAGYLEASGYLLPKEAKVVREFIIPARLRPGFELVESMRVREAAKERRAISGLSAPVIDDALTYLGIDLDPHALVAELRPVDRTLLAIGLAAAEAPAGLLVDDVDEGLPLGDRARVWDMLRTLTKIGMTVLATSTDPIDDATVIRLPAREDVR